MTSMDELPLRPELRGRTPYGAPQLKVRHRLNTNENPYPLPAALLADQLRTQRQRPGHGRSIRTRTASPCAGRSSASASARMCGATAASASRL